eukprot:Protomagalhaensia_sp_Gyna_25__5371@NODE_689_length_2838_cov_5_967846_g538_i0_p3_GENE_NODE_689_length_2838_cov_5_967846_g538_i0NODE_689_length_2838_cov_5_967846_g538_i0_p3_ORF_typecomplete_len106_score19_91HETs_218289/PF11558_8/0_07_NODE_689_length_2838_cov_5_967846_g538_i08601177
MRLGGGTQAGRREAIAGLGLIATGGDGGATEASEEEDEVGNGYWNTALHSSAKYTDRTEPKVSLVAGGGGDGSVLPVAAVGEFNDISSTGSFVAFFELSLSACNA